MKSTSALILSTMALLVGGAAPALAQPTDPNPPAPPAPAAPTLEDDKLPFVERNGEKIPLFMHDGTFAGSSSGWARDAVEVEAAYTVDCITGSQLHGIITPSGNRNFRRVRRRATRPMEAFSFGFPTDEMPWNRTAHDIREGRIPGSSSQRITPYVWVKIEPDKFEVDPEDGDRRLNLGTDTMDDIIYDTDQYVLLDGKLVVRARKRWDSPTEMRRLLIALKMDRGVDAFGIKRAAKVDVRRDSPSADAITGLDEGVSRGHDWSNGPAVPLRRTWTHLRDRDMLKSSPTYKNVLALKPKAFIRSVRSRYHLNENSVTEIRNAHALGKTRLEELVRMSRETRQSGTLTAAQEAAAQAFELKVASVLDGRLVAERAAPKLAALGVTGTVDVAAIASLTVGSTSLGSGRDFADISARKPFLEQRKVVHETISDLYHELAGDLDDGSSESLRRIITRSLDRSLEDHVEQFSAWQTSLDANMRRYKTPDKFAEAHAAMSDDDAKRTEYNTYGSQQEAANRRPFRNFQPINADDWKELRFLFRNEQVRIWTRQIEAAGSAAKGLWFDEARQFYVPRSRRVTGNFMIDTFDFAAMYSADVWEASGTPIAPAERTAAFDLNVAPYTEKLLHSTMVNEVQIELTVSSQYTDRLKELRSQIALPRYFMLWAASKGQVTMDQVKALFEELKALDDDALNARLAEFNDFMDHDGDAPISQIDAGEFRDWLDPARLRLEVRDDFTYDEPEVKVALEGAQFVFEQYRNMMQFAAELKGPSTIDRLEDFNGPDCMRWVPATESKGGAALRHAKAVDPAAEEPTTPPNGGGIGIISVLEGNTTKANAKTLGKPAKLEGIEIEDTGTGNEPQSRFYKIELDPSESIRIKATFTHSDGNLDMELLADDDSRLSTARTNNSNETIRYTNKGTTAQTVTLRVYGVDGATNTFTLETE